MLITIPRALREKLGEEAASSLVELLNYQSQNSGDSIAAFVEEKFERRLSEEIAKIRDEVSTLRTEMHKNQTATVRWMFLFWAGQIGALIGILFAFFD